ncbi:patatin-like phospholipase family protein [Ancylobacter mangrovi]|uniref:patatin-like phospholipase family protein n=1 Tax=Ancylobacter mangrovi TaxID=2972472 RepID=UPI002161F236|nr:patatin-like phospholipase family protein [Ancylobacter mangrovi]MCS0503212.1 patatin-like phospholipase family protein [Ancylobacter mangrovi]
MPRQTPATPPRRPSRAGRSPSRTATADAPAAQDAAAPDASAQDTPSPAGKGPRAPVLVDLALQGGGAHGAFTWGVIDRLLEEEWLRIDGVSGTSAGAMNAAVMADGYAAGGAAGARAALDAYWRHVADAARFSPFRRGPLDVLLGRWTLDHSPLFLAMDLMSRLYSPYDLNPAGTNPLRAVLEKAIDFERLKTSPVKLFITATNVRTGRGRVFRNAEITPDVLLASACLPTLFQAVEIDGESYWDGGYAGNPTMTPLVRDLESDDTILVPINPIERAGTPRTAAEILNRLNEVSFNSALLKELRMIALLRQVADPGNSEGAQWARMRIHLVRNDIMGTLGYSSKLNAEWEFLSMLRDEGRKAADAFLAADADNIGKRSSVDLDILLEGV